MAKHRSPEAGSAGPTIVAALIVGVALLGGSYLLSRSVNRAVEGLDGIRTALAEVKDAVKTAAPARPAPAARRGPDPNKRYTINTKGSPVRGAKNAKLTIVEVSDFQ